MAGNWITHNELLLLNHANSYLQNLNLPIINIARTGQTRLDERLSYYHFRRRYVTQDEHVSFRVLSDQLLYNESDYDLMRALIALQLVNYPNLYQDYIQEDYITFCMQVVTNHPGNAACWIAAADLFGVMIVRLEDIPQIVMTEVAAPLLANQWDSIYKKTLYYCKDGNDEDSIVYTSDSHWYLPAMHNTIELLKHNLDNPILIFDICNNLVSNGLTMRVPKTFDERVSQRLWWYNFQRLTMVGDGNCMFRSLSYVVYDTQELYYYMREVVVAQLKLNPLKYSPLRIDINEPYHEYVARMALNKTYGDYACIQAASDAYGVKILLLYHKKIIFQEYVPDGACRKVGYCVTIPSHIDCMYPLTQA